MSLPKTLGLLALLGVGIATLAPRHAEAQNRLFLDAGAGIFSPSESSIQNIYGIMPIVQLGIGKEIGHTDWELELSIANKEGKPYTTGGISATSTYTPLKIAGKVTTLFGDGDLKPYFEVMASYDLISESVSSSSGNLDFKVSGLGVGAFAGIKVPANFLGAGTDAYFEVRGTYVTLIPNSFSSSGNSSNVQVIQNSDINLGGVSATIGIKHYF